MPEAQIHRNYCDWCNTFPQHSFTKDSNRTLRKSFTSHNHHAQSSLHWGSKQGKKSIIRSSPPRAANNKQLLPSTQLHRDTIETWENFTSWSSTTAPVSGREPCDPPPIGSWQAQCRNNLTCLNGQIIHHQMLSTKNCGGPHAPIS